MQICSDQLRFSLQDFPAPVVDPAKQFPFETKIDEYWNGGEIYVERDAKEELEGLKDIPMDKTPPVDSALNMEDTG